MKYTTAAVLLTLALAAPAAAQRTPWFGTDPGPYSLHWSRSWELPALLHALERRCLAVAHVLPAESVQETTCVPVPPPPPPPGGWGCHPSDPNDPNSPPVCIDPPVTEPNCTTRAVVEAVLVVARQLPPDAKCEPAP